MLNFGMGGAWLPARLSGLMSAVRGSEAILFCCVQDAWRKASGRHWFCQFPVSEEANAGQNTIRVLGAESFVPC